MKKIFLPCLLTLLLFSSSIKAQNYAATKEKVYIHSNHVFFKPGDVLYCKFYVVKAADNTPTRISNIVYAEMLGPSGTIVQKANFPVQDGYAVGSFDLDGQLPGGVYKIRAYTSWMQNEKDSTYFTKEITLMKSLAPRILMKLDFPEKGYGRGSMVKADFSMRNLFDLPIRNYEGKYKVNIGGTEIINQSFKPDAQGKALIQFKLPDDLSVNDGLLNITVAYDAYTESISRSIPIVLNKIDLQLMPEGGAFVEGIGTYIAFKAVDEHGKGVDIKGELKDEKGNSVAEFSSYHLGMGKFYFIPKAGCDYKAVITSPANIQQEYILPGASPSGVAITVSQENNTLKVLLNASRRMDVKLKAMARNQSYYSETLQLFKGRNEIIIDETAFPTGITQLTLYNSDDMPLAERLVFTNADKNLRVTITPDKKKYLPREKIHLTIKAIDESGQPVASNFSLSVIDDKLWTFADDKQDHILSWLLLGSELKGKIEEPQFYFKAEEPKAEEALDLLLMTQGYRYFDYIDYVVKEGTLKYLPDQDHIVSGQVLNDEGKAARARLFIINDVIKGKALPAVTTEDGSFFFSDLLPGARYYLFAQSLDKKEKVTINVLQNGLGYNAAKRKELQWEVKEPFDNGMIPVAAAVPGTKPAIVNKEHNNIPPLNALNEKVIVGTEVVVTALGQTRQDKEVGFSVAKVRANDLNAAMNFSNALSGRVAGLDIQTVNNGVFDDARITLRGIRSLTGNNGPLIIINNIPMEQFGLNKINPADIESITVLKDAAATALYGARAANGVLMIETKKFRKERISFDFGNKYYYATQQIYTAGNSFTPVRKFYAPVYNTTKTEERTDFRETIYWNPVVQTDKNGTAAVEFYNSDASTTFRAIAEGIGFNGKLGRAETTYAVQSAMQVDAKIPPYLTVGDTPLLPLVIKNNSDVAQTFLVDTKAPDGFIIGKYINEATVEAGKSIQFLIPAEAVKAAAGTIQFTVSSELGKETVSLPVSANDKGFPVKLTLSGNVSTVHNFIISKAIPGTITTQLKLFKNLEGQLLDGIESMLREPYGCFEQTSSTTYPNIFVLKYLKESGRLNPAIQEKALGYIQAGYKRLIGFETPQDGFEWFGRTPPHEALTAYGLLEFTDMQEFIDVDKKMLERTKKFLLSRRDGNGTFKLESHGLDQFASVPGKIANTYIVYALTQAGIGKEIQKEYETAVKNVLANKDAYQLSMMAIAADNMKDAASYKLLMDAVNEKAGSLIAETSVVNSRDASLRVETTSLYALALMRASSPDLAAIATAISKILGEKNYYGYGSTQATVLALQAIVQYSKLAGRISEDAPVSFGLNTNPVTDYNKLAENIKEGTNEFSVSYAQKDKAIPYALEIAYSTFTPPNSDKAELKLNTILKNASPKVGETVRMNIDVTNTVNKLQPMAIAKIGIPAGLSVQPWQLKEIVEKNGAAYYEIFDNYLVFYWMGFAPNETKTIHLDLKAEIQGTYRGKASSVYLYYTPEYKNWNDGLMAEVKD